MPIHFEFNREHQILRLVLEGELADADVRAAVPASMRAVAACHPQAAITDLSRVTKFDVSSQAIRHVAHHDPPFADLVRYYVAPSDYLFGLARMFQILVGEERPNLHVVRTWADACRGLKVPEDLRFEPLAVP